MPVGPLVRRVAQLKNEFFLELKKEFQELEECRLDTVLVAENRLNMDVKYKKNIAPKDLSQIASDTQKRYNYDQIGRGKLDKYPDEEIEFMLAIIRRKISQVGKDASGRIVKTEEGVQA